MFSIITIASSTIKPTDNVIPIIENMSTEYPRRRITMMSQAQRQVSLQRPPAWTMRSEKCKDDRDDQCDSDQQGPVHLGNRIANLICLVRNLSEGDSGRQRTAQRADHLFDVIRNLDRIYTRLFAHRKNHAALAVDPEPAPIVTRAVNDISNLIQVQRHSIPPSHYDVGELFGAGQLTVRLERVVTRVSKQRS